MTMNGKRKKIWMISQLTVHACCTLMLSMLAGGCSKETEEPAATVFGGPANVTLVIDGQSATKALTRAGYQVDEDVIIETVRIYAFKHAPGESQNGECVGYGYFPDLAVAPGESEYCTMRLSASGDIDFYVLANDGFASGLASGQVPVILDGSTARQELESLRFTGLTDGATAIPMSNLDLKGVSGTASDRAANRTFTINESSKGGGLPQIIPIDLTRAMARLSFYFAKSMDSPEIVIEGIELKPQGPGSAKFFDNSGNPGGYYNSGNTVILLDKDNADDDVTISKNNSTGSLDLDKLQDVSGAQTYLLPNSYGSSDPDIGPSGNDGTYGYVLTMTYKIGRQNQSKTKDIYLPSVRPNEWLQVKGIFNVTVDVSMEVIALYWDESDNSISFN